MAEDKAGPVFKLGDKVRVTIPDSPLNGMIGTIVREPKKRGQSNSVLFPGQYSYDVEFTERLPLNLANPDCKTQRLREGHLGLVSAAGASA
jgi:hypothetical protein